MIHRCVIVVLDSVGVGALPDAADYGDADADTLGNIARHLGGLYLPHLQALGLGNVHDILGMPPVPRPTGCYGRMAEQSVGKDSIVGHWEIGGVITRCAFPTYPHAFPLELIEQIESAIGREVIGNEVASGTEIIKRLGDEHVRTGSPIVYTSADSVLQIAAHEDVIPLEEQYRICRAVRPLMTGDHAVARVIARPFVGESGSYQRITASRKDFGVEPTRQTIIDAVQAAGLPTYAVGKVGDLFAHRGLDREVKSKSNSDGLVKLAAALDECTRGLLFANLVDFDTLFGHRNDVPGFARALEEFDAFVPRLLGTLCENDALFITADHGCDPTTASTDHSREYVPLLIHGPGLCAGVGLGTRCTFADVGATVGELLRLNYRGDGTSMAAALLP